MNIDDLGDHRPGQRAAVEGGARFPLVTAGLTKDDVRAVSRRLGLRTWDKPAAACLASRVPYGTPVTLRTLGAVAAAESALRALGFTQLRVRHYGDLARVELTTPSSVAPWSCATAVAAAVRGSGIPLRHPRPRRLSLRQPQPRAGGAMIDVRVKLTFPEDLVRRPFMAQLVREHNVEPNIRRANVDEHEGWIVCELEGEPTKVEAALAWLRDQGVRVDLLGDVVES